MADRSRLRNVQQSLCFWRPHTCMANNLPRQGGRDLCSLPPEEMLYGSLNGAF